MQRQIMKFVLLGFAAVAATALVIAGPGRSSERRAVNPPGTAAGLPFSNGVVVGNMLFLSGQEGAIDGKLVPGGIGPETQAALENIKKLLELAGFQTTDVVTVNVYLADIGDFADMNKVYKTVFPEPRPARTTVQVAELVSNARVEISAIAVKQR
jgi:2-iminobutanoate/2-iminopropanoate deaminase